MVLLELVTGRPPIPGGGRRPRRLDGAPAGRPDDGGGRPGAAGRRVLCTSRTPSMQMLEDAAIGRDYGTVN
jgi:hypothetical protein